MVFLRDRDLGAIGKRECLLVAAPQLHGLLKCAPVRCGVGDGEGEFRGNGTVEQPLFQRQINILMLVFDFQQSALSVNFDKNVRLCQDDGSVCRDLEGDLAERIPEARWDFRFCQRVAAGSRPVTVSSPVALTSRSCVAAGDCTGSTGTSSHFCAGESLSAQP